MPDVCAEIILRSDSVLARENAMLGAIAPKPLCGALPHTPPGAARTRQRDFVPLDSHTSVTLTYSVFNNERKIK